MQEAKKQFIICYLLSTDSKSYKTILKKLKIENDYIRPKKLASNKASIYDVARHAVKWFEDQNYEIDYAFYFTTNNSL